MFFAIIWNRCRVGCVEISAASSAESGPQGMRRLLHQRGFSMLQIKRVFMGSLAALLIAGSVSPIVAHALPIGSALQLHASEKQNQKLIAVHVYNKGEQLQDVKVDEQVYTVKPHDT